MRLGEGRTEAELIGRVSAAGRGGGPEDEDGPGREAEVDEGRLAIKGCTGGGDIPNDG